MLTLPLVVSFGESMECNFSRVVESLGALNSAHRQCAVGHMGIEITAAGRDFLCAEMPVDERTRQPFGILHGGVSMVLVETLGSTASFLLVKDQGGQALGVNISGSHVRSARVGPVTGICRPVKIGRNVHFWHIEIRDENNRLCCDARLTVNIVPARRDAPET